jgi:imidazolonepropionase-like amidohydrolase
MKSAQFILCLIGILFINTTGSSQMSTQSPTTNHRIVIAASTVLDGKGGVLHDTRIVIEGSKIVAIDHKAGPVTYDLRGLTVLPGWIDAHVHITWTFGANGKISAVQKQHKKQLMRQLRTPGSP